MTLVPGGDWLRAEELGRLEIRNISGLDEYADYLLIFNTIEERTITTRVMKDWERRRGFWECVREALKYSPRRKRG